MHSELNRWLSQARAEDLRGAARRPRFQPPPAPPVQAINPVTLRFAFPDDAQALDRLAVTDSSVAPAMPALVAEVAGELHAALSLVDGHVIADPFRHTAAVVELLHARARQLSGEHPVRRGLRLPRLRVLRWRSAWR